MQPYVSIIIPCRNEEGHIAACIDSILKQDYPADRLEILIADGMSTDGTRNICQAYAATHSFIYCFANPRKIVPTGLNILIKQAKGSVIIRMDAHADYPPTYVRQCVTALMSNNVDNVGGVCITKPESDQPAARAIALALSSSFGVGNSLFRTGALKGPQLVDTVPFGCFKREVFDRIGLFDEDLVRNQDDEFNSRLIKNGGKILLVPSISTVYYARSSFAKLWRMYFQYGYFKPLTVKKLGGVMTWRQMVPALFIISLAACAAASAVHPAFGLLFSLECALYLMANTAAAVYSCAATDIGLFPYLMVSFAAIHFGYGLGYLKGIVDFCIRGRHLKNRINDMALSR